MARWESTNSPIRAADLRDLLESGLIHFPGSVDRLRNPVLFGKLELLSFLENNSAVELNKFFNYFVSISKEDVKENGFVFVLDCTKGSATGLSDFLELLHDYFPGKINKIYVIQNPTQDGYVGRAYLRMKSFLNNMQGSTDYPRVTLNSYSELERVIDPSQIPSFFDGHLDFDQKLWVETRIELEKLLSDFREQAKLISDEQEGLIKPIPSTLSELNSFEKTIRPLREKVYIPSKTTVVRAEVLVTEERMARNGSTTPSRFRSCPLSVIHKIDSKVLQESLKKLNDISDNFLNLWGLQLQKVYLEKFTICDDALMTKLQDLSPTVQQPLELTESNIEPQFHFYSSIYTTLASDDQKMYESAIQSHACLRDWNFSACLPADDLEATVEELNKLWANVTHTVNVRRTVLEKYNNVKNLIVQSVVGYEKCHNQISSIAVSENFSDNIALPVRHHSFTDSIQNHCNNINNDFEKIDISGDVLEGNIDVSPFNKSIKNVIRLSAGLTNLNTQCIAIKEQISLFFISIKEIQDWLVEEGHPFITSQTLGTNLEESKQGKTKFLKFIAESNLAVTKQKITQCSKTLTVILNSHFLDDRSVNIMRDTFTRTEVDWKGFGLEVQEHGRDLELSIEFYEAAQNVSHWLEEEENNKESILHVEQDELEDVNDKMEQLTKFKQNMSRHSSIMDDCHSKYIALTASSNSTLRHVRKAKTNVDSSWTRFSERIRGAEKLIEKKFKEAKAASQVISEDRVSLHNASTSSVSSMESLDFENDVEHTAFRNTKLLSQELVNTEKRYVDDLRAVVLGYKERIMSNPQCPKSLKNNVGIIFGNIENIYNFHDKIFLTDLQKGMESNSMGSVFCNNIRNFDMYATYCKNKPHSENFLAGVSDNKFLLECQRELNHILDLSSYLLKPVQRIMKYHLILEKLLKYTPERSPKRRMELQDALNIMERVPRYANDAIHLMGLEGFNGDFETLGQLLLQENFLCFINAQKKGTPRQIFIFENAVLFSKPVAVKPSSKRGTICQAPKYSYKNHYLISQINMTRYLPEDSSNTQFQLDVWKKNNKNTGERYVLQAPSTAVRDQWMGMIEGLLLAQLESMKNRAASNVL